MTWIVNQGTDMSCRSVAVLYFVYFALAPAFVSTGHKRATGDTWCPRRSKTDGRSRGLRNVEHVSAIERDIETCSRSCGGGAWSPVPRDTDVVVPLTLGGASVEEDAHTSRLLEAFVKARRRIGVGLGENLHHTVVEANNTSAMGEVQVIVEAAGFGDGSQLDAGDLPVARFTDELEQCGSFCIGGEGESLVHRLGCRPGLRQDLGFVQGGVP